MTTTEAGKDEGPSADDYALVTKVAVEVEAPDLPYRPPMPRDRSVPIALVGAGGISGAHLDAYARHGLNVVAICSRDLERARARRDAHFPNARLTDDFDSVLRDPDVSVLDLTAHPDSLRTTMTAANSSSSRCSVASSLPSIRTGAGRRISPISGRPSAQA
jgi:hypothetical protein